jgi:hypothetical protein
MTEKTPSKKRNGLPPWSVLPHEQERRTMSTKTKLKLKLVPHHPKSQANDISDELNNAIEFAFGLQFAIMGQGDLCGFDSSPLSQLVDSHIEQLEKISHSVDQLRAAS